MGVFEHTDLMARQYMDINGNDSYITLASLRCISYKNGDIETLKPLLILIA